MSQPIGSTDLIVKQASDDACKAYWVLLFDQYGSEMTKDVMRRLKVSMVTAHKVASVNESNHPELFAVIKDGDSIVIEGSYDPDPTVKGQNKFLFKATLDKDAEVVDMVTIDVTAQGEKFSKRSHRIAKVK